MHEQKRYTPLMCQLPFFLVVSLLIQVLSGCSFPEDSGSSTPRKIATAPITSSQTPSPEGKLEAINELADSLHDRAIADSRELNKTILRLVESGANSPQLDQAKNAWFNAHASLTTLWSIYQAPALWENLLHSSAPYSVYSLLDATPMLAGYLDTIPGYPSSGLISALEIPITTSSLVAKHQYADTHFVVFGLHPLEFFLWEKSGGESTSTDAPPNPSQSTLDSRRQAFLQLVSEEYKNQLIALRKRWHQQKLATAYLDKPNDPAENQGQTKLSALMNYIDRYLTEQLQVNHEGTDYLFAEHFQYSKSATRFWQPVLQGISNLLKLSEIPEIASGVFPEPLSNCLKKVTTPKNDSEPNPCQNEILSLKAAIILSFSNRQML